MVIMFEIVPLVVGQRRLERCTKSVMLGCECATEILLSLREGCGQHCECVTPSLMLDMYGEHCECGHLH